MPDILISDTDRMVRVTQSSKAGRSSFKSSMPSVSDLEEGVPQYAFSKTNGLLYQFIRMNGIMYHSAFQKGEVTELDIDIDNTE